MCWNKTRAELELVDRMEPCVISIRCGPSGVQVRFRKSAACGCRSNRTRNAPPHPLQAYGFYGVRMDLIQRVPLGWGWTGTAYCLGLFYKYMHGLTGSN